MSNKINIVKGKTDSGKIVISGQIIFQLIDTFGFPLDLIYEILNEQNIIFDMYEFITCAIKSGNFSINKLHSTLSVLPYYDKKLFSKVMVLILKTQEKKERFKKMSKKNKNKCCPAPEVKTEVKTEAPPIVVSEDVTPVPELSESKTPTYIIMVIAFVALGFMIYYSTKVMKTPITPVERIVERIESVIEAPALLPEMPIIPEVEPEVVEPKVVEPNSL